MRFSVASSPHIRSRSSVRGVMFAVAAALLPGLAVQVYQFGPGVLIHGGLALASALGAEALLLSWRCRPLAPFLADGSAILTALLLAVALPPIAPWWITVFGSLWAIVIGKQLYGGLGHNPFNPAMVGYAVLLISFPRPMTAWLPPAGAASLGFAEVWGLIFGTDPTAVDAVARATPLDVMKTQLALGRSLDEIRNAPPFGGFAAPGWQWVNLAYLAGGLWMIRRRVIAWQIPASMLGVLFGLALVGYLAAPGSHPTPLFHLLSGATMLGAFFIATDPVSASTSAPGRLIYGGLIGLLVFVIRSYGGYPDGVAFAVLLMNFAAPTIDHFVRPRVYGHPR